MKSSNYWQQFASTGKIEDYLNYALHKPKDREMSGESKEDTGIDQYAGIHMRNRNDIESGAYRGI